MKIIETRTISITNIIEIETGNRIENLKEIKKQIRRDELFFASTSSSEGELIESISGMPIYKVTIKEDFTFIEVL